MADISKITLPSGTTYDIKDAVARAAVGGAIIIRGTTTTALTDEATTNPITIDNESYTAVANDAVFYQKKEFVFDGTKWHEFGDMSGLGALATKDSASGSYTPAGSVTLGDKAKSTVSPASSGTATYTPAGSVTFGTKAKSTVSPADSGAATYTPAGTIAVNAASGTGTSYTPEGSVEAPTISVSSAGSTTTIHNPTKVTVAKTVEAAAPGATAPSNSITYYSVANETLSLYQIGYTTGDSITVSDTTVKTGDASYTATAPAFTGTEKKLAFSGTGARLQTDSEVPSAASFSGTGVRLETDSQIPGSASFSGTAATITVS